MSITPELRACKERLQALRASNYEDPNSILHQTYDIWMRRQRQTTTGANSTAEDLKTKALRSLYDSYEREHKTIRSQIAFFEQMQQIPAAETDVIPDEVRTDITTRIAALEAIQAAAAVRTIDWRSVGQGATSIANGFSNAAVGISQAMRDEDARKAARAAKRDAEENARLCPSLPFYALAGAGLTAFVSLAVLYVQSTTNTAP